MQPLSPKMGKSNTSKIRRFRMKREVTQKNYNESDLVIKEFCYQCPEDSAGVLYKDGRCQCMCTHFVEEPLLKGKPCRRRTVTRAPKSPSIPVDVILDKKNGSISLHNAATLGTSPGKGISPALQITLISSLVVITFLALVLLGVFIIRKRSFKCLTRYNKQRRMEMKREAPTAARLLPEYFINNPTYETTCVDLAVQIYPTTEVTLVSQIGQGCFGKVYKGELHGETVAVKKVKPEHAAEAVREIETMANFSHPNILPIVGIAKSQEPDSPWLLFEYMEHGDLASVLRSSSFRPPDQVAAPQPLFLSSKDETHNEELLPVEEKSIPEIELTPDVLTNIAVQIAEGMKYLSTQHFVHRDLAARNCLVSAAGVVKISDFGLSRDVYTCDYYKVGGSKLLPIRWMAPEGILYGCFTLESDVWAYGIVLWEIFSWGKQPYYGHCNEEVVHLILTGVLCSPPKDCPPLIQEIMAGCWKTEAKHRLTFSKICHKFTEAGLITKKYKQKEAAVKEVESQVHELKFQSPIYYGNGLTNSASKIESEYEIPRKAVAKEVEYLKVV